MSASHIECATQAEADAAAAAGDIIIWWSGHLVLHGNSSAVLWDSSSARLHDSSSAFLQDSSSATDGRSGGKLTPDADGVVRPIPEEAACPNPRR